MKNGQQHWKDWGAEHGEETVREEVKTRGENSNSYLCDTRQSQHFMISLLVSFSRQQHTVGHCVCTWLSSLAWLNGLWPMTAYEPTFTGLFANSSNVEIKLWLNAQRSQSHHRINQNADQRSRDGAVLLFRFFIWEPGHRTTTTQTLGPDLHLEPHDFFLKRLYNGKANKHWHRG